VLGTLLAAPKLARGEEPASATEKRLAALEKQLEELRADRRAAAAAAEPRHVSVSGYVHIDAVLHNQASQDEVDAATREPLNRDRFLIRRARLRLDGDYGVVAGALELDANTVNGPQARPVDAEISLLWRNPDTESPPYLMATAGLMRTPFGMELSERETTRWFLERSQSAQSLFPGIYDLGARLSGGYRALRYSVAAMNGAPIGDKQFPGRDPSKSKDVVVRFGVDSRPTSWLHLEAGGSGLSGTGFHEGTPSTKDVLIWRDTNEDGIVQITEVQAIAGRVATASETFHRAAVGLDAKVSIALPVVGLTTVSAEMVWATNLDRGGAVPADPVAAGRDLRERGFHIGFTQELTRWAAVGARYDHYDPDADSREQLGAKLVQRDQSMSTTAFVVAARYTPYARLIGELDINRNHAGRTAGGLPGNLAANAGTLRAEIVFR
jgi:hypothetical protein